VKIALIYEKFISRGGLENYLYSFASQLVENGHELEIVTGETDSKTGVLSNTKFHKIPRKTLGEFSHQAEQELQSLKGIDVSIGFGRTVVHDLHRAGGGCHKYYSDHVLHPLKRIGRKNRSELALEHELYTSGGTRHFVVNSEMVAGQLKGAYGIGRDQVSVIHTAVDSERFCRVSEAVRASLRSEIDESAGNGPVFLFVSMNHRRKGLDALLHAWKVAPAEARLWVVGPELNGRYLKMIRRLGIESKVRSFVHPPDLVPFYQAADYFVHPTLYDACANTVLQSLACGLPGVISQQDGAQQFISDGENGILLPNPDDPDAIVEKLHEICAADREKMALAARAAAEPLTWDAHIAQWMSVIESKLS